MLMISTRIQTSKSVHGKHICVMIWNMYEYLKLKIIWSLKGKDYAYNVSMYYSVISPFMQTYSEGIASSGDSMWFKTWFNSTDLPGKLQGEGLGWATLLISVLQDKIKEKSRKNRDRDYCWCMSVPPGLETICLG